ncbi:MAG TPA: hypothetical protein VFQ35_19135, partial [Polyangiaceae bacterium]|nr:hypothetical protein [Polyangiaceae bacterium]
ALLAAESRRRAKADLVAALGAYAAARETNAAYTSDRIQRAEAALVSLAAGVESSRVSTRDAVILQEPLFDLLLGAVEARRLLCISSVNLVYAAGLPMNREGVR